MKASGLLFAGSGEKRGSQPVGLRLARGANSLRHVACLIRAQAHCKDSSAGVFLRQPGPSHFLGHAEKSLCKQKVFDKHLLYVYNKSSLEVQDWTFSAKCPHVSGKVSDQRHPARTGAGNERLAMFKAVSQVGNSGRTTRSLQVEAIGDFFAGKTCPRIRIAGKWLERAGFKPGHRVHVVIEGPGMISLRFVEASKGVAP